MFPLGTESPGGQLQLFFSGEFWRKYDTVFSCLIPRIGCYSLSYMLARIAVAVAALL